MKSLWFPGISVTIALSLFKIALNRLDFPTLGLPAMATLTPSKIKEFLSPFPQKFIKLFT
jgi:hypothetical protein